MGRVYTRRLTLEVPVRTPDGGGGQVRGWEERGAIWADVRMRSGGLKHSEFGRTPRLQVRIKTHALPDGHPTRPIAGDRLRDGSRVYEVEATHEDLKHVLVILASDVTGERTTP